MNRVIEIREQQQGQGIPRADENRNEVIIPPQNVEVILPQPRSSWSSYLYNFFPNPRWRTFIEYVIGKDIMLLIFGGNVTVRFSHRITKTTLRTRLNGYKKTEVVRALNDYITQASVNEIATEYNGFVSNDFFLNGIHYTAPGWIFDQHSFVIESSTKNCLEIYKLRLQSKYLSVALMAGTMGFSTLLLMNFIIRDLEEFWKTLVLSTKDTMLMNLFNELELSMKCFFLVTFMVVPLLCKAALKEYYIYVKWARVLFNSIASFQFNYIDFDADFRAYCTELINKGN
jgi:hypothetical protein